LIKAIFQQRDKGKNKFDHLQLATDSYGLNYLFYDFGGKQITFEPTDKGYDVMLYKQRNDSSAYIVEGMSTNLTPGTMTIPNVVDRAIIAFEYLKKKYKLK